MSKGMGGFRKELAVFIVFIAAFLAWGTYILIKSGVVPTPGKKYSVTAIVPTSGTLVPASRVTVAGAQVGTVGSVDRADALGLNAKVELKISDTRVFPFPDDSRVEVRTRSQVGENYVEVLVGKSEQDVPDGGELGLQQANTTVPVDEILTVLQGKTRDNARTLMAELGGVLTDRETELNDTIRNFNEFAGHGGELVGVLHENRRQTAEVLDRFGRLMSAVGDRGAAIDTLAHRGEVAARAVAERDAELEETFRELPSTLASVRGATQTIGDVSDSSAPVVSNLATAVRELEPAVRDFAPAARDGLRLINEIDPALRPLGATLTQVSALGESVPDALPGLEATLCQLNPMLRYVNPYANDVLTVLYGLGSTSNSYDANGHLIRLLPLVNESSGSGAPKEVLEAEKMLLQSGAFLKSKSIAFNAFMEPGQVGREVAPENGRPANGKDQTALGFEYERVEADC